MTLTRSQFHLKHLAQAQAEAARLFAQRDVLPNQWLTWVAGQLYSLRPAAYASMVRRELEQLQAAR